MLASRGTPHASSETVAGLTDNMESEEGVPVERAKPPGGLGRLVKRRLPILEWAPRYDRTAAVADLIAGVTLGLTLVPQSIAYASLANLPVQYGLYSAYIGTILYVVLGTVKEVSIGPTSLMALLTLQICRGLSIEYVVLLTFLSGCIVFVMGLLRLGFLVELISPAVTSGFTSATAVIIVVSQLKGLLGLSFVAESVADNVRLIALHRREVRVADCGLGLLCCAALLMLRKLKDLPVSPKRTKLRKALWLISIGRNAAVVVASSVAAYCLHEPARPPLTLSGRVQAGVPRFSLPAFSVAEGNRTVTFPEMAERLGAGLLMLPVVMVLANIAIAKAFSAGRRVDATQEMLTLGLVNAVGALGHAMPACGAFTRSAVSHSSGVRSPAAGLYSGLVTLTALVFLTDYFYYIPKACLSAVLICAVIFMIDVSIVGRLWRRDRTELATLAVTFVVSLARTVELAVLAGVLASLAALLHRVMRPAVPARRGARACLVRPTLCLCYLNAELVCRRALAAADAAGRPLLLLDCGGVALVDYTAAEALARLQGKLRDAGRRLLVFGATEAVAARLEAVPGLETAALRTRSAAAALNALRSPADDKEEEAALLTAAAAAAPV